MNRYDLFELTEESGDVPIGMECELSKILTIMQSCINEDLKSHRNSSYYLMESDADYDKVLLEIKITASK